VVFLTLVGLLFSFLSVAARLTAHGSRPRVINSLFIYTDLKVRMRTPELKRRFFDVTLGAVLSTAGAVAFTFTFAQMPSLSEHFAFGGETSTTQTRKNKDRSLAAEPSATSPSPFPSETPITPVAPPSRASTKVTRPPTHSVASEEKAEFSPLSHLSLDFGFQYFVIDSTDRTTGAQSIFVSNLNPQVQLIWDLDWSKDWSTHHELGYASSNLFNTNSTTSTINNGSGALYSFEIGPIYRVSNRVTTQLTVGSVQKIYSYSPTPNTVNLERVQELEAKGTVRVDVFRVKSASAGLELSIYGLGSGRGTGYSTQAGLGGNGSLYMKRALSKTFEFHSSVYYGESRQNSDFVEQVEKNIGITLGMGARLGDP
jgi:hypothetical protein